MSFRAKRELLSQISPRYREASDSQKRTILDQFVAATGYVRKYAIRLLNRPVAPAGPIRRPRAPVYGEEVQHALAVAWAAANSICAKRLVPFLPELVQSLERHGHLNLTQEVRSQLLSLSAATADRILQKIRRGDRPRGLSATKAGKLLKHQVPVRTFAEWDHGMPGFLEGDLVCHCGPTVYGSFVCSLVLTDVASGWVECVPISHRSKRNVILALEAALSQLPFPVLGIDTDNGSEFLNHDMIMFCEERHITFTRGRAYKKNDQCFVEQKNGSVVRQLVGYDRYEGNAALRQIAELYKAVRLYVNMFQPSMKLRTKSRDGARVTRSYDDAQTPLHRILAFGCLAADVRRELESLRDSLDPVRLLRQVQVLQDALWRHAISAPTTHEGAAEPPMAAATRFDPGRCTSSPDESPLTGETLMEPPPQEQASANRERKYLKQRGVRKPHTWRTRPDPFEAVTEELVSWFLEGPDQTGNDLLLRLQRAYPGRYPDHLLRTLQRRVQAWRASTVVRFHAPGAGLPPGSDNPSRLEGEMNGETP